MHYLHCKPSSLPITTGVLTIGTKVSEVSLLLLLVCISKERLQLIHLNFLSCLGIILDTGFKLIDVLIYRNLVTKVMCTNHHYLQIHGHTPTQVFMQENGREKCFFNDLTPHSVDVHDMPYAQQNTLYRDPKLPLIYAPAQTHCSYSILFCYPKNKPKTQKSQ